MEINFLGHPSALLNFLLVECKVVKTIFVAPWLHKTKVGPLIIFGFLGKLMLKVNLQSILPIVPRNLATDSLETAFFTDSVERLEA